jgi:hypothetical protein
MSVTGNRRDGCGCFNLEIVDLKGAPQEFHPREQRNDEDPGADGAAVPIGR